MDIVTGTQIRADGTRWPTGTGPSTFDDGVPGAETEHDWNVDGWAAFTQVNVNPHGSDSSAASVQAPGRGRVTGTGTSGNRRDAWLRDDTEWEDSEIRSLWSTPSPATGSPAPQMGHIHRAVEVSPGVWRGFVITNNIAGAAVQNTNLNIWQFDGAALTLGSNGASMSHETALRRDIVVRAVDRFQFVSWFNRYQCEPFHLYDMVASDEVDITDMSDTTFTQADITPSSIDKVGGVVALVDPTDTGAVALKAATGKIVLPLYKRYWPRWVASRLIGNKLYVKSWRSTEPEPGWGNATYVGTADFAGVNIPSPNVAAAPSGAGFCGLISAHLQTNAYIEFSQVSFRRL
jgi:hypothetical protein